MRHAALTSQGELVTRRFVEWCCQGVDSKDYASEYLALYYGLLRTCRYMRDPKTVEFVRAPYRIFEEILAGGRPSIDCDDWAGALAAGVLSMGGSAQYVTVAFRDQFYEGRRQYSHVFARALEPRTRTWVVLDPVAGDNTKMMLSQVRAAKVWPIA